MLYSQSLSLHPGLYKWVLANLTVQSGISFTMHYHAIHEGVQNTPPTHSMLLKPEIRAHLMHAPQQGEE